MNNRLEEIRNNWDSMVERWNDFRNDTIINGIINNPYSIFRPELQAMFKKFVGDFTNKRVLIPASGDNRAAYAFHLLGAKVTSSDLSEKQMEYSAQVARQYSWDIEFVCDDAMKLSMIKSSEYDLVFVSNGVMIWMDDLDSLYANINRVLKLGGRYIMYDAHPFMFPFDTDDTTKLTLKKDYNSTGPFGKYGIHTWRLQDILNAMISAGLNLEHVEEMNAEYGTFWVDWDKAHTIPQDELNRLYSSKSNPLYALPQAMAICAKKGTNFTSRDNNHA